MKRIAIVGMVALAAAVGQATEYFVDCTRPDDSGDGLTVATAFQTIQAAINAAPVDSVITVLPGVYDKGKTWDVNFGVQSRVYIYKRLTLRGRDGAEKTIILGAFDPNGNKGRPTTVSKDSPATRPISVAANGVGSVISNLTLTGGVSAYGVGQSNERYAGGGIGAVTVEDANPKYQTFVVDCIISNNLATAGGGASRVTLVRTKLTDNEADTGAGAVYCHAAHSLFDGNRTGGYGIHHAGAVVNCTFVDNYRAMANNASGYFLNCVFLMNGSDNAVGDNPYATNCLTAVKGAHFTDCTVAPNVYQMAAPVCGDYRLLSTSAGKGIGRTAPFAGIVEIPAEYLWTDFEGVALAQGGQVQPGCYQSLVTPKGGRLDFYDAGKNSVCGRVRTVANQYAYAVDWPSQLRLTPVVTDGEHLICYQVRGGTYGRYRAIGRDGTLLFTMPPTGVSLSLQVLTGSALYVDADKGDDSYAGSDLGSSDHPYETIQAAIDAGSSVVYVAEGTYAKGGKDMESASNRVAIASGPVRIVATGRPEKTEIVGAADPNETSGCGAAAMRCVAAKSYCFVQGFTLTGGHGGTGDSGNRGGAFYANSSYSDTVRLTDCIISNCVAGQGAVAYCGVLERCRIYANTNTSSGSLSYGRVSSSVFADNSRYVFGDGEKAYNCTVVGNHDNIFRYSPTLIGSVFVNNSSSSNYSTPSFVDCWAWDCTGFPTSDGLAVADPLLADTANGDYRPISLSPVLGGRTGTLPDDWWVWTTSDIDGNPLYIKDGHLTAGACQTGPMAVVVSGRGISPVGTNVVEKGESLVVTATDANRTFEGFLVNGTLDSSAAATRSLTVTNFVDVSSGAVSVSAKYAPLGFLMMLR